VPLTLYSGERMMKTRAKALTAAFILFILSVKTFAADTEKIFAIISSDAQQYMLAYNGFKDTVGKNTKISVMSGTIKGGNENEIASAINSSDPLILLAVGTKALKFAKGIQGNRKIIHCMVFSEKEINDSNTAGIEFNIPESYKAEKIKEIIPNHGTMGVIYTGASEKQFLNLKKACEEKSIPLLDVKTQNGEDFPKALNRIKNRINLFMMVTDSALYYPGSVQHLFNESVNNGFGVIGLSSFYTKAGAVLSFDFNYYDVGADAARLAFEKFYNGVNGKPAESGRIVYSLNVSVAQKAGIDFSAGAVDKAAEVFGR